MAEQIYDLIWHTRRELCKSPDTPECAECLEKLSRWEFSLDVHRGDVGESYEAEMRAGCAVMLKALADGAFGSERMEAV